MAESSKERHSRTDRSHFSHDKELVIDFVNEPLACAPTGRPAMPSQKMSHLHTIAMLFGTSAEAFASADQHHVLHESDNGDCWLLRRDPNGALIVCHVGNAASGQHVTDRSVALFLLRDIGSPQHQALLTLVERLLCTHLGG